MDRFKIAVSIVVVAVLAAACGAAEPAADVVGGDLLFISARGGGIAVVEHGESAPRFSARNSTPSADWETVVKSRWRGNTTKLIAFDPSESVTRWEAVIGDTQRVKIVSGDGTLVATSPVQERSFLRGRRMTTLTIAGSSRPEPRRYELKGNFEPEAFSTDGSSLFVVSYVPARRPTNYQVRRLDLDTGEVTGVYTPDAHLQQKMGGTARIQAASSDGSRLYTLYTLEGEPDVEPRAFVHVLDLDELWAHCIELPSGFETSDESDAAITVSEDGKHVYLADSNTEVLVDVDAETLQVHRQGLVDLDIADSMHLAEAPDGTLYAASGIDVVAVDLETFEQKKTWQMFSNVAGLQVGNDPGQLFVGVDDRVIVLDVATGARLESIDPVGVRKIGGFGSVMPSLAAEEEYLTCAC